MSKRNWIIAILAVIAIIIINFSIQARSMSNSSQLDVKGVAVSTPTPLPSLTPKEQSLYILDDVNKFRAKNNLAPAYPDPKSCNFAQHRAEEITTDFEHTGFKRRWALEAYYGMYDYAGENLAKELPYDLVVTAWENSPSHRDIMLGDYENMCVGLVFLHDVPFYTLEVWRE